MRKLSLIVMAVLCACGGYFAGGIGKREAQHAAVSVCVATKAKGGALSVDVGLCLEQLIAKRRVDISKEACGLVLACTRANGDVVKDACAALAEVGVAIDKIDTCNCRVNLSSRASSDEAAELAVRSYARALKMIVEGDENRIDSKNLDEIHLRSLKMRLRINELARLQQLLNGASPQLEAKLDEDIREAKDMYGNVVKEELDARRVLARDRIVVEVLERKSDESSVRDGD